MTGSLWSQLPEDGGGEAADADDEHPDDEGGAEPVVDLAAVEEDFEAAEPRPMRAMPMPSTQSLPGFPLRDVRTVLRSSA